MSQTLLISLSDIQQYRSITANLDATKSLEPYILDAQEFDLRVFLGEQLWIDFLEDFEASPSLTKYADLFNGTTYTYSGRKWKHEGLKAVLVHYTYYRYVLNSQIQSTKFGLVVKKNEFSDPAPENKIARIANQAKSAAITYQERVKLFLDFNYATYPLWKFGYQRKKGQIRLTGIGGNSSRDLVRCNRCRNLIADCRCVDSTYINYNIDPEIDLGGA